MKDVVTTKGNKYIDLADLSSFLTSEDSKAYKVDGYRMQLIEEVAFLCVNDNFIKDIEKIRKQILKKNPKLNIPTSNYHQAERLLGFVYSNLYKTYKKLITELIEKYKLIPDLYWRDKFLLLESKAEDHFEYAERYGDKITKKEALLLAIEEITDDMDLELLDSIILRNKPFDKNDGYVFWANAFFTRITADPESLIININKKAVPYLEIGFPIYATLPEMQKVLKDKYYIIQEYRKKHLSISTKRDHRKDNLPKMIDAFLLDAQGKDKVTIANILDKKYSGETTFEAISQLIKRMKEEAKRFNHTKQER